MSKPYQERSKRKKKETYEERKVQALAEGTRVEFLTCPLCGRNRPLETWGRRSSFKVKLDYAIVQVRYGGGRGIGFFLAEDESIGLTELRDTYPEIFNNLKAEVSKLHEFLSTLE